MSYYVFPEGDVILMPLIDGKLASDYRIIKFNCDSDFKYWLSGKKDIRYVLDLMKIN